MRKDAKKGGGERVAAEYQEAFFAHSFSFWFVLAPNICRLPKAALIKCAKFSPRGRVSSVRKTDKERAPTHTHTHLRILA